MLRKSRKIFTILLCVLVIRALTNGQTNKYANFNEPRLTEAQQKYLDDLEAECKASGNSAEMLAELGYAYMFFTLSGHLSLLEKAEYYLEEAFSKNQNDMELNKTLGRFYNIRMVDLDFSKTEMQVKVYGALLGDKTIEEMSDMEFVSWTFYQMAGAIQASEKLIPIKALRIVKNLEGGIQIRIQKDPHNVEFHALGGNFAFFLAGNVPFGRKERVLKGIKYFEYVRENWDKMRPGAKNTYHCPNTYANFMFQLADAYLIAKEKDKAIEIYTELTTITDPRTRPKEIIAEVSKERMKNANYYMGKKKLMPPWPSDMGNCIVCHSYQADIPMGSIYSKNMIDITKIPSKAVDKPY